MVTVFIGTLVLGGGKLLLYCRSRMDGGVSDSMFDGFGDGGKIIVLVCGCPICTGVTSYHMKGPSL